MMESAMGTSPAESTEPIQAPPPDEVWVPAQFALALHGAGAVAWAASNIGKEIVVTGGSSWSGQFWTAATTPALALAFWIGVSRWEAAHGVHRHGGAAALLVVLALVFFFLDIAISSEHFSLFYGVALVMLGFRLDDDRLFFLGTASGILAMVLMSGLLEPAAAPLLLTAAGISIATLWWGRAGRKRKPTRPAG